MPGADESTLALASWLRALSDDELEALVAARELRTSAIKDWFDLAEALLGADSIAKALARLDRATLTAIAAGDAAAADLAPARQLGLVFDGVVPAAVQAAVPDLGPADPPAALVPVAFADQRFTDRVAAERAFQTTDAVGELLAALERGPARALAKGGMALPDSKRLAAAMRVSFEEVPPIAGIAERAGLITVEAGRWLPTRAAAGWADSPWGERWSVIAGAWLDRLPQDIRVLLADRAGVEWGDRLVEAVRWLFPLGGDWMTDRVSVYTRDAALLGITASNVPSTAGGTLLVEGAEAAAPVMAALFPPTVESVFVQHDLSIVATGSLRPDLDTRLREFADRESGSTYRVSTASITRALAMGRTEEELRAFLSSVSSTGVPQPLEYLLRETAARYGSVRVRPRGAGAEIRADDELVLRAIRADALLAPLGLMLEDDVLRTGFDRDQVFWALADARYPVAAEDDRGRIVVLQHHLATVAPLPPSGPSLVERLRRSSADPADDNKAWLARQLDIAIRGKVALTVSVTMPAGEVVEYQLEPASIAGGRLRARDRASDLERTLPLASITAIRPAHSP